MNSVTPIRRSAPTLEVGFIAPSQLKEDVDLLVVPCDVSADDYIMTEFSRPLRRVTAVLRGCHASVKTLMLTRHGYNLLEEEFES